MLLSHGPNIPLSVGGGLWAGRAGHIALGGEGYSRSQCKDGFGAYFGPPGGDHLGAVSAL